MGWHGYDELAERLRHDAYEIQFLAPHPTLADYMDDIARCQHLVCGDTLAMHLAFALGRTVLTILPALRYRKFTITDALQKS